MNLPILLAPKTSIGIRNYADSLSSAFQKLEYNIPVCSKPHSSICSLHFHLGNSTRMLWRYLFMRESPSVVTLHDVIPRSNALRFFLGRLQIGLLNRHLVVVHSNFSMEMLRSFGFHGDVRIIHHGADSMRFPKDEIDSIRSSISPLGQHILISAGILKKEKGIIDILSSAEKFPQWRFLFVGRIADPTIEKLLKNASDNVVHIDSPDKETFQKLIAASDVLLNFRTDSVGEASGPVVQAHALGTPVLGYSDGFLPEYCGQYDVLFPRNMPLGKALCAYEEVVHKEHRIPLESPIVTTWDAAAVQYLKIYEELNWI